MLSDSMVGMPRPDRPVTLADIALDLGISKMAVSKALRNHHDISESLRQRVKERARELNYRQNWMAAGLRLRRTKLVGMVVPTFVHSFFAQMVEAAGAVLEERGYQAVVTITGEDPDREVRQIGALISRQVEGFIVATCMIDDSRGAFRTARKAGVPVILAGRRLRDCPFSFVGVDNFEIGRMAVCHLLKQGRRRIAHLRGPEISTGRLRLEGYQAGLGAAGMEFRPEYVAGGTEAAAVVSAATRSLLRLDSPPDAIFCYNDQAAAAALNEILAQGLRVPDDIALIGVGNIAHSDILAVPLTTIDHSAQEMGKVAAELLADRLTGDHETKIEERILPAQLIVRRSCGGGAVLEPDRQTAGSPDRA